MSKQYINVARYKNQMLVREIVDGKEIRRRVKFNPSMFQSSQVPTEYQNFYQNGYVSRCTFDNSYDMKTFIDEYKDIPNEVWGNPDITSQFIYEEKYDTTDSSQVITSYLDIEVCTRYQDANGNWVDGGFPNAADAEFPINAICDYRSNDKKYYVFSTALGWTPEKSQLHFKDEVVYVPCVSEEDLLKKWLYFWQKKTPHIITGWNVESFDIPYIVNRISRLYGKDVANKLSPWDKVDQKTIHGAFGNDQSIYIIQGISTLDYLELYKKYRYIPRERYTLGYISQCECPNEAKLEFKGTHGSLYYDDPVFFVDYNIQDVRCIVCFERDLGFVNLACFIAYFAGVNFGDNFSPVKVWENLIYKTCMDSNIIIPLKDHSVKKESFEGAYVHPPVPGLKGCICSFDYTSLYPSIMREWYIGADVYVKNERREMLRESLKAVLDNNSEKDPRCKKMLTEINMTGIFNNYYIENDIPECVTEFLQKNNVSLSTNFEFFDISKQSIFVDLITRLFKERKADKKTSFKHKHNAQDIQKELERRGIKV